MLYILTLSDYYYHISLGKLTMSTTPGAPETSKTYGTVSFEGSKASGLRPAVPSIEVTLPSRSGIYDIQQERIDEDTWQLLEKGWRKPDEWRIWYESIETKFGRENSVVYYLSNPDQANKHGVATGDNAETIGRKVAWDHWVQLWTGHVQNEMEKAVGATPPVQLSERQSEAIIQWCDLKVREMFPSFGELDHF